MKKIILIYFPRYITLCTVRLFLSQLCLMFHSYKTLLILFLKGMNKSQEKLKWVVDMTIGYRNGNALDMLGMCVGYIEPQNIHVHFRAYPVSQIPQDSEDLLQWLYARYEEKEKLLDHFYKHGVFPPDFTGGFLPLKRASQLVFDLGAVILFHLFFIVSVYLQYTFVLKPLFGLLFWCCILWVITDLSEGWYFLI